MKLLPITALFPALPIIAFSAMLNFSAAAISPGRHQRGPKNCGASF
jgi:hypothetical protein